MKTILRGFLINLFSILITAHLLPGLVISGGLYTIFYATLVFMVINALIVPVLKIMFLPLNLLTLGFFSWAVNVLALYILTTVVPQIKITSYFFPGLSVSGITLPAIELNVLYVAIIASFMIGFISHFLKWMSK